MCEMNKVREVSLGYHKLSDLQYVQEFLTMLEKNGRRFRLGPRHSGS